jgi:hypothetical protein
VCSKSSPSDWSVKRRLGYVEWAKSEVTNLREGTAGRTAGRDASRNFRDGVTRPGDVPGRVNKSRDHPSRAFSAIASSVASSPCGNKCP